MTLLIDRSIFIGSEQTLAGKFHLTIERFVPISIIHLTLNYNFLSFPKNNRSLVGICTNLFLFHISRWIRIEKKLFPYWATGESYGAKFVELTREKTNERRGGGKKLKNAETAEQSRGWNLKGPRSVERFVLHWHIFLSLDSIILLDNQSARLPDEQKINKILVMEHLLGEKMMNKKNNNNDGRISLDMGEQ